MTTCRVCFAASKLYVVKNGFEVYRCPACGFGQVDVAEEVLAAFYDKDYFAGEKAGFAQQEHEAISVARRRWIENELVKLKGGGPLAVLEIGPGLGGPIAGYFERERPADSYAAVEFSEYAAERLRARGLEVFTGRVVEPALVERLRGRFDFIFGTEVIEHDMDPHGFLGAVRAMLKPGGRAAFTTGNLSGWMSRRHKANWYYLDPPAHVSLFTPKAARRAMTDEGFVRFGVTRYGFQHLEVAERAPAFLRPAILWATDAANVSTGMTISGERAL